MSARFFCLICLFQFSALKIRFQIYYGEDVSVWLVNTPSQKKEGEKKVADCLKKIISKKYIISHYDMDAPIHSGETVCRDGYVCFEVNRFLAFAFAFHHKLLCFLHMVIHVAYDKQIDPCIKAIFFA
mgnify:CR=1 FL=1